MSGYNKSIGIFRGERSNPSVSLQQMGDFGKIDLMEDQFDVPMIFDEHWVLFVPFVLGQDMGTWGEGVAVYGAARGHRRECKTPLLMADMYGFASEEEMEDTKAYLLSHGQYQLEQVGE